MNLFNSSRRDDPSPTIEITPDVEASWLNPTTLVSTPPTQEFADRMGDELTDRDLHYERINGEDAIDAVCRWRRTMQTGTLVLFCNPDQLKRPELHYEIGTVVGLADAVHLFVSGACDSRTHPFSERDAVHVFDDIEGLTQHIVEQTQTPSGNLVENGYPTEARSNLSSVKISVTAGSNEDAEASAQFQFGTIVVQFGRDNLLEKQSSLPLIRSKESILMNATLPAASSYITNGRLHIEYILPIHSVLGVKFKPYVDVTESGDVAETISLLERVGFWNVGSGTTRPRRVYFLLPLDENLSENKNVVQELDEEILNNYLYPK